MKVLLYLSAVVMVSPALAKERMSVGASLWSLFDSQNFKAVHISYELNELYNLYHLRPTFLAIIGEQGYNHISVGLSREFAINSHFAWGMGSQVGIINKTDTLGHKLEFYSRIYPSYKLDSVNSIVAELVRINMMPIG
jgi:hypothetical protein